MSGGYSTHFPSTLDLSVSSLPKNDGELVHLLTELPSGMGSSLQAKLTVQNNGRARVKFWKDRRKNQQFMDGQAVALSDFPKDLYVEGIVPGAAEKEITIKLQIVNGSNTYDANSIDLTVTPVLTKYQVSFINSAAPTFSGQSLFCGAPDSEGENVSVDAQMITKNMVGEAKQIQILSISNPGGVAAKVYDGTPSSSTSMTNYSYNFASPNAGMSLVDVRSDGGSDRYPFYVFNTAHDKYTSSTDGNTGEAIIEDNPNFPLNNVAPNGGQTTVIDMTWTFTDYLVWVYPDGSAYPLGRTSWLIRFSGSVTQSSAGPPSSYSWAPDSNNANMTNTSLQLNNFEPNIHFPPAEVSLRAGGFQQ